MQLTHILFGTLLLVTGSLARHGDISPHRNLGRNTRYCFSKEIASHDVSDCECLPKLEKPTCRNKCDAPSCAPGLVKVKHVNDCSAGCRLPDDSNCSGCGLWFHSVCNCVKDPTNHTLCLTDKTITKGPPNRWIRLNTHKGEHDLVTSTSIIPGILEMTKAPSDYYERGWTFAQEQWKADKEALAMNPWVVRTMEQVHIHICDLNSTLRDELTKQTFKSDKYLKPLDTQNPDFKSLYCIGFKKGVVVDNFVSMLSETIRYESGKGGVCPELVGAGMMMDNNQRTWACATTERHGPLGLFCSG